MENPRKADAATLDDGCETERSERKSPEHLTIRLGSRTVAPQLVRASDAPSSSAMQRAAEASAVMRRVGKSVYMISGQTARILALLQVFRC
ncbi:hypothetical protein [Actinomadura rubrisoli]|uniref:Uncharacterized protein n=1 Tax=Actinomadura rubrisoli TaxID=2530368 RepID=A0A4R5BUF2_9ACTN|nr:hypothetical protein [Actinomadura rubrisoli]TDD87852.1 hypothetical protein E1298_15765 [Actinomadura rubrisoli]